MASSSAGRDRGASLRARRGRSRCRRRRRARLAVGADRPGRRGARQRPARHAAGARPRRSRARAAAPAQEPAARHDRAAAHRRPLPRGHRRRHALAARDGRATTRPFAERLQAFWTNHFSVSLLKGSTRGLIGAFERDAVRPNIAGRFETLLFASTTHPAMLRYLDNTQSAGPHSPHRRVRGAPRAARVDETARVTGINENLAREVLELHTLGAESARAGSTPRPTSRRSRPC